MTGMIRLAIRETAKELTSVELGQVSGGAGGSREDQKGPVCDIPTDCWIEGGDFVFNDD